MTSKSRATTGNKKTVKSTLSLPTQKIMTKLLKTLAKREQ